MIPLHGDISSREMRFRAAAEERMVSRRRAADNYRRKLVLRGDDGLYSSSIFAGGTLRRRVMRMTVLI